MAEVSSSGAAAACRPTAGRPRARSSATATDALLLDAGSGARRLVGSDLLDGVERLHVVLTHFHMDHVVGLFYAADLEPGLEVWAAARRSRVSGTDTRRAAPRLPVRAAELRQPHPRRARAAGGRGGGRRVSGSDPHPAAALEPDPCAPSRRRTRGCTDTAYDAGNEDFVRGVSLLGHEAFHAGDATDDRAHTASGEAARLAAAAGVGRLVLIHVDPALDDEAELLRYAEPHFEATVVGTDGLVLDV